ncbi:MAG: mechanosensitive ion channel family protein [Victivallaceae bacterium]|nr:mechanosensitive ion channel family protein [Victivallaceae bacterium]
MRKTYFSAALRRLAPRGGFIGLLAAVVVAFALPSGATELAEIAVPGLTAQHRAAVEPEPPPADNGSLLSIISGEAPLAELSEQSIRSRAGHDWRNLKKWWHAESGAIMLLTAGAVAVFLAVWGGVMLVRRAKKKLLERGHGGWHVELLAAVSEPLLVLIGLGGGFILLIPVLRSLPDFYTFNIRFFFTLVTLCMAWGGMELIAMVSRRMTDYAGKSGDRIDPLMVDIVRKIMKIILVTITVLFIGQSIFNFNLTMLLTGAGVAGLAVAFASKATLANFFGTVVIVWDKPFRCGDRIQINGIDGIVSEVGMRSTRIHTPDETVYAIPNSQIELASIENISKRGVIRFVFTIGLVYDTPEKDIRRAIAILHEITDDFHGTDVTRYKPHVFFDNLGDSGLNIKVIMWLKTSSFTQEEQWRTEINLAIVKRFADENIVMAYTTTTGYLYGDPAHPLYVSQQPGGAVSGSRMPGAQ